MAVNEAAPTIRRINHPSLEFVKAVRSGCPEAVEGV
jgi:hypothetical protein